MIRLFLFLLAAVAVSLLAAWLADHPGQVALTWQGVHVETSFAVLMIAVLLLGLLLVVLFEIIRLLGGAPRRIGHRLRRSRVDRGYQALAQGLVAAAAGDTSAAKALNRRADKLLGHAPATLLLSAQAAQLEGDEVVARARFQEMLEHQETEFLGLRGLLAQAMKEGDWENALQLARRAHLRRPNTPWVLTTLFDLQTRSGLWTEALSTVSDMARHKLIDRSTATRWRALLYHQRAAAQRAAGRPYEALYLARKAHKLHPDFAPIAVQASALAEQSNQPRVARKVLESAWKAKPHPALAKAYFALGGNSSASERLKLAQRLHELQPRQLESELALAEQAIAAKAWPAAREALERARKLNPTASVYRLLAEVAQAEGDGERARAYLAQAVDAAPDHAWLCETTGQVRANWSAFGPDGRFDSLRWGAPPKIVPLLGDERAELIPPSPERAPQVPVPMTAEPPATAVRDAKVDAA